MKYLQILILLSTIGLSPADPKTKTEEYHRATPEEKALIEEMDGLWEKIGPHAERGSKLAKDNWSMFKTYYRQMAKSVTAEIEGKTEKTARHSVAGATPHHEIFALMCIPTAYGWPESRTLNKDTKYTGLVPIHLAGEYEVLVEIYPAESEAMLVLEIDGKASGRPVKPNEKVTVSLEAGVRALSVRTNEDVHLQFSKLHLNHIAKK